MPNKTIYVRDADLPLWEEAQKELGDSISALFAEFLRKRIKKMNVFVHVLHATRSGIRGKEDFTVLFAPTGPTGTGGPMTPHYVRGYQNLNSFLVGSGLTPEAATKIGSDLKTQSSIFELLLLPNSVAKLF
jgi:hypothetical protein